eukprot:CAMPEP_0115753034 /NCGR_PEP_ID=MMETSP0272-20121206/96107_1 /TAXON_ID=71861 /ORGANISM="Scrippsiella trochoidea, Strain CCMP3099" /LENGTH=92 /DNA_ID=CAMNT_0003198319 /DNA_START=143 /DNA_END=422 /DNA_ORIENTATION=+
MKVDLEWNTSKALPSPRIKWSKGSQRLEELLLQGAPPHHTQAWFLTFKPAESTSSAEPSLLSMQVADPRSPSNRLDRGAGKQARMGSALEVA